jgi:hypothetical protein
MSPNDTMEQHINKIGIMVELGAIKIKGAKGCG